MTRQIIRWTSFLLSLPPLLLTMIGILFTYACWYPAGFLRNFSGELDSNISYSKAMRRAWAATGNTPF